MDFKLFIINHSGKEPEGTSIIHMEHQSSASLYKVSMANIIFISLCLMSLAFSFGQCCCSSGGGGGDTCSSDEESLKVGISLNEDVINWKGVSFTFAQGCDFTSMDLSSAQVPG